MSHELRTPLNHMIGFNELLIEDTGLSAMQRTYITAALNSAKGLLSMIDNILEYSRLEGSVIPLDTIDFDLYDVLDDVIDALRKQAVSYGICAPASAGRASMTDRWCVDRNTCRCRHCIPTRAEGRLGEQAGRRSPQAGPNDQAPGRQCHQVLRRWPAERIWTQRRWGQHRRDPSACDQQATVEQEG